MKTSEAWSVCAAGLILFCAGLSAHGQSRPETVFTNKILTFTNLQGHVYDNASLIRADTRDVIFKTNGDYGTVSLTNLSPATLGYIGVPADYLDREQELTKQKAESAAKLQTILADEQKELVNSTNLPQVMVESVLGAPEYNTSYGNVYRCNLRSPNGAASVAYVARLPLTVTAYLGQLQAMDQTIKQLTPQIDTANAQLAAATNQIDQRQTQINRLNAVTPVGVSGDPYYVDSYSSQRAAINLAQVELDEARKTLDGLRANTDALIKKRDEAVAKTAELKASDPNPSIVRVLVSRIPHNGSQILVCAPDGPQLGTPAPR